MAVFFTDDDLLSNKNMISVCLERISRYVTFFYSKVVFLLDWYFTLRSDRHKKFQGILCNRVDTVLKKPGNNKNIGKEPTLMWTVQNCFSNILFRIFSDLPSKGHYSIHPKIDFEVRAYLIFFSFSILRAKNILVKTRETCFLWNIWYFYAHHRVHTEWQWPLSGVYSIMMEK